MAIPKEKKNTFQSITDPTKQVTAQQQGQQANKQVNQPAVQPKPTVIETPKPTGTLQEQRTELTEDISDLSGNENKFASLLQEAMNAKAEEVAPYNEARMKVKQNIQKTDLRDYKGLRPEDALRAYSNDIAMKREKLAYIDQQKADAQADIDENINAVRGLIQDQVAAMGLQLQDIGLRIDEEWQKQQFDESKRQYDQSFAENQRQFNVQQSRLSSGSGSSREPGTPTVVKFGGQEILYQDGVPIAISETPFVPGQVVDANNEPVKNVQLQTAVTEYDNSLNLLDQLKALKPDVNTGFISGRVNSLLGKFDQGDPKALELNAKAENLKSAFIKALAGSAVSAQEQERLQKFLPSPNDSDQDFDNKLQSMYDIIGQQKETVLNQYGAKQIPYNLTKTESATNPLGDTGISDLNFNLGQ